MNESRMFVIIGASGKVGCATAMALRKAGMQVRAVLRDEAKAEPLIKLGCEVAIADLQDAEALAKAINDADTVQVILPPSLQDKDPAEQMRLTIERIALALERARPKRVLAISDYGAHVVHDIGMPTMFHALEKRLGQLDCHKVFLRSAEHMQGWGRTITTARISNTLPSFHVPVDKLFPTISAPDVGLIAAELLLRPAKNNLEIFHAEGPQRYSAEDVAKAVGDLLGQNVEVEPVPRSRWSEIFERIMSPSLATLLIKANDAQNQGELVDVEEGGQIRYGSTPLIDALRPLVTS